MSIDHLHAFAFAGVDWIKRQQARLRRQARRERLRRADPESLSVWGKRYAFTVEEIDAPPSIELSDGHLLLRVRPGTDGHKKHALTEKWLREQVKNAVTPLLAKWQPRMRVRVERVFVRRMKTKWGSCNYKACTIRLNTELASRPPDCLEYVVVHELVHLLEPSHNARFVALMDQYMPAWRLHRDALSCSASSS